MTAFQNLKPNRWNHAVSEVSSICVGGELHAKVWDTSAAGWALRPCGTSAWWFFDPVVGDALRTVGDSDRAALAESKGFERASHWSVVLVGVAAQVVRVLGREREDRPSNTVPAHRRHAVNDVVVGIGTPSALDIGVGLVWPGSERKDGERASLIDHKEAVSVCDVFLSINPARVSVGPLSCIPIRLHESPGTVIRALNELEVVRGCDSILQTVIVSTEFAQYVTVRI